jgi:hypothetical protein
MILYLAWRAKFHEAVFVYDAKESSCLVLRIKRRRRCTGSHAECGCSIHRGLFFAGLSIQFRGPARVYTKGNRLLEIISS